MVAALWPPDRAVHLSKPHPGLLAVRHGRRGDVPVFLAPRRATKVRGDRRKPRPDPAGGEETGLGGRTQPGSVPDVKAWGQSGGYPNGMVAHLFFDVHSALGALRSNVVDVGAIERAEIHSTRVGRDAHVNA
ncbi:hypothetical protein THAOC_23380 [Thalassiosira oceanica]|uniref:Uncharacterized protein n=1 Tax=Thalassiosira oceanica TaxID=159749 RepID=K0SDL7_THAOC|nr:hypothetical protein THAOC_23380 [Thalassiosira oceanica]|eukprot:EJK56687.1 hypothetical protein THAOC_23380 [Thalassiosira oceanica]